MTIHFEWDPDKADANLAKHGVDFVDATQVFFGTYMEYELTKEGYGERRFKAVGEVQGRLVAVVYTMRGKGFRLISARGANRHERKAHCQFQSGDG